MSHRKQNTELRGFACLLFDETQRLSLREILKQREGNCLATAKKDKTMKKMTMTILGAMIAIGTMAGATSAAEIEIKMLNKGEKGAMVFEPDFVRAAPGDTIKFVSVDAGHNAETIKGMFPEGAETFKSAPGKEFSTTLNVEGVYGIRCTPHYGLGMVALIVVGNPVNEDAAKAAKNPGKAKAKFATLFSELDSQ